MMLSNIMGQWMLGIEGTAHFCIEKWGCNILLLVEEGLLVEGVWSDSIGDELELCASFGDGERHTCSRTR